MSKLTSALMLVVLALAVMSVASCAQAPTGIITRAGTDESGAVIPNATVTNAEGLYSAPALTAGEYEVCAELTGFRTLARSASVEAGSTTNLKTWQD
jgi:Carboxypeptidase regulatory-like domain